MVNFKNRPGLEFLWCLFLVVVIAAVYWQVSTYGFVNLDDDAYVYENHHLREGFSIPTIKWAFTTFYSGNWHPLTWLSHALDYEIYGLDPMGHHWTNVQFHIANSVILFFILQLITGTFWRSALVAALFALHPLHVESVAWISSRKGLLSTFWGLLAIAAYYRYVTQPRFLKYLLVILCLCLGLMAKPMLVTLPFVLLLLDYWPLKRFQFQHNCFKSDIRSGFDRRRSFQLLLEKIPLFIPVVISSVLTIKAQKSVGALFTLESLPLHTRIENAGVSYVNYVFKTIWPHNLAVYYPYYGDNLSPWKVFGAALLITIALFWTVRLSKRFPYMVVGMLWYIGTLVPVIGLVQVGGQAMADRYTYIPLTGIFIIVVWGTCDLFKKLPYNRFIFAVSGAFVLTILSVSTYLQAGYWKDSFTLYQNAIAKTENNFFAYNGLGAFLYQKKDFDGAIHHYKKALGIKPDYDDARSNLGLAYYEKGEIEQAVSEFKQVLKKRPHNIAACYNLGNVFADAGQFDKAALFYQQVLKINPKYIDARFNLANTRVRQGNFEEAAVQYAELLKIEPHNVKALYNFGNLLFRQGKYEQAVLHCAQAIKIDPQLAEAYDLIGVILAMQGKDEKARVFFSKALQIRPNDTTIRNHFEKFGLKAVVQ